MLRFDGLDETVWRTQQTVDFQIQLVKKGKYLLVGERPDDTSTEFKLKQNSFISCAKTEMTNEFRKHEITSYRKYWKVLPQESRSVVLVPLGNC